MNLGAWYGYEIIFLVMSNVKDVLYYAICVHIYESYFGISKPKVTGRSMFIHLLIIIPNLQKNITQKTDARTITIHQILLIMASVFTSGKVDYRTTPP